MRSVIALSTLFVPLALVLVLLLMPLTLSSLGSSSDDDPRHLRLVWFGGEDEERAIRESVNEFLILHPGWRVTVQMTEWTRYNEKVMTMLLGHRPPDVSRMSVQWCQRYWELGALADITPHLASTEVADFVPSRLASCTADGALFGLPHTSIGLMVYYNRDLFRQAGIEPPSSPESAWTWDEFTEIAERLQRDTGVRYGWGVYRGWFPLIPLFYQSGGHLLTEGEPDFANPANVDALDWFIAQHTAGIAPQTSWTTGGDSAETLFIRGDSAMVITGNWRLPAYARQIDGFEWGVTYLPQRFRRASNCGGENIVVFNTPKVAAATALVEHLTARDQMERFCSQTLFLPTRRALLEEGIEYRDHGEELEMFARQSLDFEPEWAVEQSTPEFAAIDQAFVREVELAVMGYQSAEECLEALNASYREARFQ